MWRATWRACATRRDVARVDVSDVKKEDLLPLHFFFQITGIVQDHCTMVSENLGVDFNHISVGEKRNFFDLVSCPGFGA
jgi:hypothetical protein